MGLPHNSGYCASKAALHSLGESWSHGFKEDGVDVTVVAPGFIDTPLTRSNNHKMPMLMDVRSAAQKIERGLSQKKTFITFPWVFYAAVKILSLLPHNISSILLKKFGVY